MTQHKLTINTEEGTVIWQSPIIEGKLDCLIIDSMNKVSITVDSELGYNIFHTAEHIGIEYYAPRAILQGPTRNQIVSDQFNKFNINESLVFRISGPKNSNVSIIYRTD